MIWNSCYDNIFEVELVLLVFSDAHPQSCRRRAAGGSSSETETKVVERPLVSTRKTCKHLCLGCASSSSRWWHDMSGMRCCCWPVMQWTTRAVYNRRTRIVCSNPSLARAARHCRAAIRPSTSYGSTLLAKKNERTSRRHAPLST